ncbi:class I SAM-dependent methyltransferase [Candidatus Saccharibacteria bacterium]|nr:class I SAM-dependent methyltransferase [Candidatus Saccharibacteria bacterium]
MSKNKTSTKQKSKANTPKGNTKQQAKSHKKADHYNDPNHNYLHYWNGRDYEHASEVIALSKLLGGKHFDHAVDVGGGYGRLSAVLTKYADKVTLAEPSQQQLDIAQDYLKDYPTVDIQLMQADDLKFDDASIDLVTVVRVLHHLPDPTAEFAEIARILKPGGYFFFEFANYANFKNRVKHIAKGKKLPLEPVDIRSEANRKEGDIAFVNHNPKTVRKQLAHAGLKVEKVLSVSNLRSPRIKKIVPHGGLLAIENLLQGSLANTYFGPSTVFLVKKPE